VAAAIVLPRDSVIFANVNTKNAIISSGQ